MKTSLIFALAAIGIALGAYSAYVHGRRPAVQQPAFRPASNPYERGVYATGIIESAQSHGSNINIYPEVSGPVARIFVTEGSVVRAGDPLVAIDDSVQRAIAAQQWAQADAALAVLDQLKAQPRPEALRVGEAQVDTATASLKSVQDRLDKFQKAYAGDQRAISLDDLDGARNAVRVADANLAVARRQYDLLKAGTWSYDLRNQEMQHQALAKAAAAADTLLAKYTLRAPCDGIVLSIQSAAGSYVSPQGAFNAYSQGMGPLVIMGTAQDYLEVRCYVDEILVPRLPGAEQMTAKMLVRGTEVSVPLAYERMQPLVIPKIELADQRRERVDVRVLPLIFRFAKPNDLNVFPGQLVDVYIGQK